MKYSRTSVVRNNHPMNRKNFEKPIEIIIVPVNNSPINRPLLKRLAYVEYCVAQDSFFDLSIKTALIVDWCPPIKNPTIA